MKTIALALLIAPLTLIAQVDRTHAPEAGPAPIIELGESTVSTLSNGLKVIVVENHRLPKVSWSLSLEHTPYFEGNKAGMLDIFGELMRAGSETKSKAELDEAIDFLGASISVTSSMLHGSSLTRHSEALLDLMSDVLYNPAFDEDELKKLITQSLSGLAASETSPNDIASNLTRSMLYGHNHPYGTVTTAASLESLTREDFVAFHNTYFRPNIAYLVVVGDIDAETALTTAEKYFGDWEKGEVPYQRWATPERPQGIKVCLAPLEGAVQSLLKLTHISNLHPGSDDAIAASVMNNILGGGAFSGRLIQNLREDKAFTYGARSSLNSDPLIGSFTAYADVRNEVTDSAVVEFMYEIRRMITEQVDSASLALTKSYMTGSFARALENPRTVAIFSLNIEKYNLPDDYYATYLERLSQVTIEDIQNAAKKYLRPDQIHITCVGDRSVAEGLQQFATSGQVEFYDVYGQQLVERSEVEAGVSAEAIITAHYEAIGGVKKLSKLKSVHRTGSVEVGGAMTLGFSNMASFKKGSRGSFTSFSMSGQEIISNIITDEGGVMSQMGPKQPVEGGELLKSQWEELSPIHLLLASDYGVEVEILGVEAINGVEYNVLKFTNEEAEINITNYFEVESGLLRISKSVIMSPEGPMSSNTEYNNYLDLGDGILFPIEINSQTGIQQMSIRIASVEVNSDIAPEIFNLD
jgi:predicted Zn-dependent peptidase